VREKSLLLFGSAVCEQGRPDEIHADATDELRRPRPRQFFGDDVVLDGSRAPAAVLTRPGHTDEARAREFRLPLASECDLVTENVEPRRKALAVLPWQVGPQPPTHLVAQRSLGGRGSEIHAVNG
jgi:hypothetical protein